MINKKSLSLILILIPIFSGIIFAQSPEIVGHRGAAFSAPENTMVSVRKAVNDGADAFEVDIHMSKDGKLVVIHDATTKRTTGVDYTVADVDYEMLKNLDAGSFKSEEFAGEPIPLLDEVLHYLPENVALYIEIKGPIELVPNLQKLLNNYPSKRNQLRIIAFDIETLTEAKKQMPDIPCYFLKTIVPCYKVRAFVKDLKERNLDGADLYYRTITPRMVKALKKENMPCLAWTVNSIDKARELVEMGVVGITTDKPGLMKREL